MSTAEDYISEDKNTGLSRDDSSVFSDDHQDHSYDLDELYASITESPASLSDELDVEAAMESDVSILEELEAMYGHSDELNTSSNLDELATESEFDSASEGDVVLHELEALLGESAQSLTNSTIDETASASDISDDNQVTDMSALDELKEFLDETPAHESSVPLDSSDSDYEYLFNNRRSILDELQNLLQSCIDELKATAEGKTGASLSSTEVEYPNRTELKELLENKLSQLMMISEGSVNVAQDNTGSVLDELSALLGETGSDKSEIDSYISSIDADNFSVDKEVETNVLGDVDFFKADEQTELGSALDELKNLSSELNPLPTLSPSISTII